MTSPAPVTWVELPVLVEDQPAMARALLDAAGPDRHRDVRTYTGGFLVPSDLAAAVSTEVVDGAGDVRPARKTSKSAQTAADAAASTSATAG